MPEPAQLVFACLDQLAPDAGAPVLRVDVDREQLAVGIWISALADADEAHDAALLLCNESRRPPHVPLDRCCHGQRLQLLGWKRMRVGRLPGLDLDPCDSFGVVRCSEANHGGEPTLPG